MSGIAFQTLSLIQRCNIMLTVWVNAVNHTTDKSEFYSYVQDLSIKKQDKALIHAQRARNIKAVLLDPKDTSVESAQFRYIPSA